MSTRRVRPNPRLTGQVRPVVTMSDFRYLSIQGTEIWYENGILSVRCLGQTVEIRMVPVLRPPCPAKTYVRQSEVKCGELAAKCGLSPAVLSNYLSGHARRLDVQTAIVEAFCALARQTVSVDRFFGPYTGDVK